MKDIILFDAYYLPAFFQLLLMSIGVWLFARMAYLPLLYRWSVWHPAICELSIFIVIFYFFLQAKMG
ncbi:hypothetical protein L1D26_09735 [Vibrio mediterranei]|uniref:hypothetical protein n=1 Tax=Vibrio mediterranei TaxID=689 RepID=UPI001EFD6F4A|nr:hypothetical protein [Vibrio mediterranei]MCG9658799.1 hypothetical protein [Vibrio mediterranei]MCG9663341.1 hypothetical protein [Vibrio mediterranei]